MASGILSDEYLRANQSTELKEAQFRKFLIASAIDQALASLSRDENLLRPD